MTTTEKKYVPSDNNPNEQPLKKGWIRRLRRWTTRAVLCLGCFVLLAFVVLYFRMEFPNEMQLLGKNVETSFLAKLQGNDVVCDEALQISTVPLFIGHRGSGLESNFDPTLSIGNTEEAIQAAIDANVDWIEIDIRISKDGRLVVFHDKTLGVRTNCSEKWADQGVCDLDWKRDLEGLHLKIKSGQPEKLLLLDDVLKTFSNSSLKWIFDIKPERDLELDREKKEKLLPIIQDLGPERVMLFGNYKVLDDYLSDDNSLSGFKCGLLMQVRDNFWTFLFNRESLLAQCKELDVDYLVIPGMFAETSFINRAKEEALKRDQGEALQVLVWDCENPVDQKNFVARGVSGLIVDRPAETQRNWAPKD